MTMILWFDLRCRPLAEVNSSTSHDGSFSRILRHPMRPLCESRLRLADRFIGSSTRSRNSPMGLYG